MLRTPIYTQKLSKAHSILKVIKHMILSMTINLTEISHACSSSKILPTLKWSMSTIIWHWLRKHCYTIFVVMLPRLIRCIMCLSFYLLTCSNHWIFRIFFRMLLGLPKWHDKPTTLLIETYQDFNKFQNDQNTKINITVPSHTWTPLLSLQKSHKYCLPNYENPFYQVITLIWIVYTSLKFQLTV